MLGPEKELDPRTTQQANSSVLRPTKFSTISPLFPHWKMFCKPYISIGSGVLSIHRKRDLPAGERRQRSSRESATKLTIGDRATGSLRMAREGSYSGSYRGTARGTRAQVRGNLAKYGITSVVIWKPNQSSKKSDRKGGLSQGRPPFRFAGSFRIRNGGKSTLSAS